MQATLKHRWINTAVLESTTFVPALPWERASKRARRIHAAQVAPLRATA